MHILKYYCKKQAMDRQEKKTVKKVLLCPKCGREMEAKPFFSPLFCGFRAQAVCPEGCLLNRDEQERLNLEAGDLFFT